MLLKQLTVMSEKVCTFQSMQIVFFSIYPFGLRGHSLTMLTRRGRFVVLEMSTACQFFLLIVKEFLHQRQPWIDGQ